MQPTCCVPLQTAASSDARVAARRHVCTGISRRARARVQTHAKQHVQKTKKKEEGKPHSMPELRLPKDATPSSDTQHSPGLQPTSSQHLPPAFTQTPVFLYKSSHTCAHARACRQTWPTVFSPPKAPSKLERRAPESCSDLKEAILVS